MADRRLMTAEQFREEALAAGTAADATFDAAATQLRAAFAADVKAGTGDSREVQFTISTGSVDRMGDTIDPKGWVLDTYRKNPVVLWAHDASLLPIAKADKVWIEGDSLKAIATFVPKATLRFADTVLELIKGGFLSATSVGFIPLKWAFADDKTRGYGIDFQQQELLEFSIVPVPANAEALIEGKAAGIDIGPLAEWAERIVTANGKAVVSRERIERIERAALAKRIADKRKRELDLIRLGRRA